MHSKSNYSLKGLRTALVLACVVLFLQLTIWYGWGYKSFVPIPFALLFCILLFAGLQYWPVCFAVCLIRQFLILDQSLITATLTSLTLCSIVLAVAYFDRFVFARPISLNRPRDVGRLTLNSLLIVLLALVLERILPVIASSAQANVAGDPQISILERGARLFLHTLFMFFLATVFMTSTSTVHFKKHALEFLGVMVLAALLGFNLFFYQALLPTQYSNYFLFILTPLIGLRLGPSGVACFAVTLTLTALWSFGVTFEKPAKPLLLQIDEIRILLSFVTISGLLTSFLFKQLQNQKERIQEQASALQIAANVYASIGEAIAVTDIQNKIVSVNPAFENLVGLSGNTLHGIRITTLIFESSSQHSMRSIWHSLDTAEYWEGTIQVRSGDKTKVMYHLAIYSAQQTQAVLTRTWLFSALTPSKITRATIYHQANFDSLTGLANRASLFATLNRLFEDQSTKHQGFLVIFIDLDNLKNINDVLGHDAGDEVLLEVATRLSGLTRSTDLAARLGGDEFAILSHGRNTEEQVTALLARIYERFQPLLRVHDFNLQISLSAGVARYPGDGVNAKELLMHADQAMYAAKKSGKNRYCIFEPWMQQQADQILRLKDDIKEGLANDHFELYFQPIIDLQSGAVIMAEALLRWNLPDGTQRMPGEFIAQAEDNGAIIPLGEFVFQAVGDISHQLRLKHPNFIIALNISARQFDGRESNTNHWPAALVQKGISPEALCLEVTERLLLSASPQVSARINQLKEAGFKFSIDDFGTGYSSFSALQTTRFSYLKIDKSFTTMLTEKGESQILIKSIIALADGLGLHCIAEGIETATQLKLLQDLGCRSGQGHYLHHPLSLHQLENLLNLPLAPNAKLTQQAAPT